jgi:hypothetical protein
MQIDGIYLPMTSATAQAIADYFHMHIPGNKISDLVWKNAEGKIKALPLSGSGYHHPVTNQWFSPKEVVQNRINTSDASIAFSSNIEKEKSKHTNLEGKLLDGHLKWLTLPPQDGSMGMYGWRNSKGDPIQRGYGSSHKSGHSEYASGLRLVDNRFDIQYPNGKQETLTMDQFLKTPYRDFLFDDHQDLRNGQLARYDLGRDKANLSQIDRQMGREPKEEIAKSIPDDGDIISPKSYGYQPGVPPEGYKAPNFKRAPKPIEDKAKEVLQSFLKNKRPIGTMVSSNIGGKDYRFRSEVHSNSPYGISVYEQKGDNAQQDPEAVSGNSQILQRLSDYLDKINETMV